LPYPPIFSKDEDCKDFLMTKMINAQEASLGAPVFIERTMQVRKSFLNHLKEEFGK